MDLQNWQPNKKVGHFKITPIANNTYMSLCNVCRFVSVLIPQSREQLHHFYFKVFYIKSTFSVRVGIVSIAEK